MHLQAFQNRSNFDKPNAVPLTFGNAIGETEPTGELVEGVSYTADTTL